MCLIDAPPSCCTDRNRSDGWWHGCCSRLPRCFARAWQCKMCGRRNLCGPSVGHCCYCCCCRCCWQENLSHTHTRARTHTHSFSHAHSLCTGTTAESRLPPSREKKPLTAGEVWRPSIVRRSRAGSAGKLGPIHRCTRARTEARVCNRGFILPLPSHPSAIPPSILNPLLLHICPRRALRPFHPAPRAKKKPHSIETHTHTRTHATASCDTFIPHIFITTARHREQAGGGDGGGGRGSKKKKGAICCATTAVKQKKGGG